jgi:hypothetical protein
MLPTFDRNVDESIGSALPIRRDVPLIVTEGNYSAQRRRWMGWSGGFAGRELVSPGGRLTRLCG